MKVVQVIKVAIVVLIIQQSTMAQEVKGNADLKENKYSIENCVNHFEQDKAIKPKWVINIGLLTRILLMEIRLK